MFKGKQIKYLTETTNSLTEKLEKHDRFIKDLEKLVKETKDNLNQMSSSRFESISDEIKEFNEKVVASSQSLEKVQKDLGELEQINNQITQLEHSINENKTIFQNNNNELNKAMTELQTNFSETNSIVTSVKNELLEERKKVSRGNEKLVKQEVIITEKVNLVDKLDREVSEARGLIGKLTAEKETLEKELLTTKTNSDKYFKELTLIREEFNAYRKKHDDKFSFDESAENLLKSTTEGLILLELYKRSPQTVDGLSESLDIASVMTRKAINNLQDLKIVKYNDETRNVSL